MGHRYRLELDVPGRDAQVQEGELLYADGATLRTYLEQCAAITASPTLSSEMPCTINVSFDEEGAFITTRLPDADAVGVLLHRMRPFILENEPASFLTVAAVIGREIELQAVRDLLAKLRRDYDGRTFRNTVQISVNDTMLNIDRVVRDWLNSHEYHRDPDKREAVQELLDAFPGDLARSIFVSMLVSKMRACMNLAKLCRLLLGEQGQLKFEINGRPIALSGSD